MTAGCCPTPGGLADTADVLAVRAAVFRLLAAGQHPTVNELAVEARLPTVAAETVLTRLVDAGMVVRDGGVVVGGEGISATATGHSVEFEEGWLHTWCAFDSVGIPAAAG